MARGPFSFGEKAQLQRLHQRGLSDRQIGALMGRHFGAVQRIRAQLKLGSNFRQKLKNSYRKFHGESEATGSYVHAEDRATIAKRLTECRRIADIPRTIEMAILGDPLPGRSALDRMRAEGRVL